VIHLKINKNNFKKKYYGVVVGVGVGVGVGVIHVGFAGAEFA
jgi:hypothetical protein